MSSYVASAHQILSEASEVRAHRVCIYDAGTFTFPDLDEGALGQALVAHPNGRYKLQSVIEGRWTNVSPYKDIVDSKRLAAELERTNFSAAIPFSPQELFAAYQVNPDRIHAAMRKLLYDGMNAFFKSRGGTGKAVEHLTQMAAWFPKVTSLMADDHGAYFASYLNIVVEAAKCGLADTVRARDGSRARILIAGLSRHCSNWVSQHPHVGARVAAANILGQVCSLYDREKAAEYFEEARVLDATGLVKFFYLDMGLRTYFSAAQVRSADTSRRIEQVKEGITRMSTTETGNTLSVAVSVDPHFFRIYSSWLYFYAQQLPEVDFHFFLCGGIDAVEEVIADGENFLNGLTALNRSGMPVNIEYHRAAVPDFVVDPKTFYACARFFTVDALLDRYPNTYLMDVDLAFQENPVPYFRRLEEVTFAAPMTMHGAYLSPWRRHMAGNVAINRNVLRTPILADLQRYLVRGLGLADSWMLDQNALAYAIERAPAELRTSLQAGERPTTAPAFMRTWEANYRRNRPSAEH